MVGASDATGLLTQLVAVVAAAVMLELSMRISAEVAVDRLLKDGTTFQDRG